MTFNGIHCEETGTSNIFHNSGFNDQLVFGVWRTEVPLPKERVTAHMDKLTESTDDDSKALEMMQRIPLDDWR